MLVSTGGGGKAHLTGVAPGRWSGEWGPVEGCHPLGSIALPPACVRGCEGGVELRRKDEACS